MSLQGDVQPDSIPLTSACQVIGPTMPSTFIEEMSACRACWKPRTAASGFGPKIPSTTRPLSESSEMIAGPEILVNAPPRSVGQRTADTVYCDLASSGTQEVLQRADRMLLVTPRGPVAMG